MVRRLTAQALTAVGFAAEDVADVGLALTEAVSNVLRHSVEGEEYEVRLALCDEKMSLEVLDAGHGFEQLAVAGGRPSPFAEGGRGIALMRALVDEVRFTYQPGTGSVVSLRKRLRVRAHSPLDLMAAGPPRRA